MTVQADGGVQVGVEVTAPQLNVVVEITEAAAPEIVEVTAFGEAEPISVVQVAEPIEVTRVDVSSPVPEVEVVDAYTTGRRGPAGPEGPAGPPGPSGARTPYYLEVGFAAPSDLWRIEHNQNTYALSVETFDHLGEPVEGNVRYPDPNTVEVDWYYPTAGVARVHD